MRIYRKNTCITFRTATDALGGYGRRHFSAAGEESSQKSSQKILSIMKSMPDITMAEIANATGLSVAGVKKNIRKLKDANLVRRVGPDKGGHWEVAK